MQIPITLIPGDGIGPEVSEAMVSVVDAATDGAILWEQHLAGASGFEQTGELLPAETVESITRNRVAIKGPLQTPVGSGWRSINVAIRQTLDLYACLRPVETLPGHSLSRYENVDLVVVRENTEGLYAGREHEVVPGVVEALKIVSRKASERIVRFGFEYARNAGRKKITVAHKKSVMPQSEGLFVESAETVADEFPFMQVEFAKLDNVVMDLALDPASHDVIILGNLDGDLLSDLCAGLVGGLGLVPGANIGETTAVFEAVHGTAPDIAGQGIANPIALILSAEMMLRYVGEHQAADRIRSAVGTVMTEGKTLTGDLGGSANTVQITEAIVAAL